MRSQPQPAQEIEAELHRVLNECGYLVDSHNESVIRQEIARSWNNFFGETAIKDCIRLHADELHKKPRQGREIKRWPRLFTQEELAQISGTVLVEHPWIADSDRNGELLADWIEKNVGGSFTVENYRAAIQVLKNQLDRRPPQPVISATPPEPTEVLEKLADATHQLSINASEWELSRPGVTPLQLRDYLARARKSKEPQRPSREETKCRS